MFLGAPSDSASQLPLDRVLPMLAGALFALGWFILIDALVVHSALALQPSIELVHFAPGLLATFSLGLVCCTPFTTLNAASSSLSSSLDVQCARAWLFTALVLSFSSMTAAGFLARALPYDGNSRFSYTGGAIAAAPPRQHPSVAAFSGDATNVSVAETTRHYTIDVDGESAHIWLGAAAMLQTMAIFAASTMWIMARVTNTRNMLF